MAKSKSSPSSVRLAHRAASSCALSRPTRGTPKLFRCRWSLQGSHQPSATCPNLAQRDPTIASVEFEDFGALGITVEFLPGLIGDPAQGLLDISEWSRHARFVEAAADPHHIHRYRASVFVAPASPASSAVSETSTRVFSTAS